MNAANGGQIQGLKTEFPLLLELSPTFSYDRSYPFQDLGVYALKTPRSDEVNVVSGDE